MTEQLVKYETGQGEVQLSPQTVKNYLVRGKGNVSDQEVMMFLQLCKYQKLNPFLNEAYLIKFGSEPATIITGKETFTKRAAASDSCEGWEAGVIVQNAEGKIEKRKGTLILESETLVGGWAKVYRKDWEVPMENTVSLKEYERRKSDGSLMANWKSMPATMIRKVALVQALREAMPQEFQGLYSPEEMPVDDSVIDGKGPVRTEIVDDVPAGAIRPINKKQADEIKKLYEEKGMTKDSLIALIYSVTERSVNSVKELNTQDAEFVIGALREVDETIDGDYIADEAAEV